MLHSDPCVLESMQSIGNTSWCSRKISLGGLPHSSASLFSSMVCTHNCIFVLYLPCRISALGSSCHISNCNKACRGMGYGNQLLFLALFAVIGLYSSLLYRIITSICMCSVLVVSMKQEQCVLTCCKCCIGRVGCGWVRTDEDREWPAS